MNFRKKIDNINFYSIIDSDIFYATQAILYCNEQCVMSVNETISDISLCSYGLSIHFLNGKNVIIQDKNLLLEIPYNCCNSTVTNNKIAVYDYDYKLLTPLNNVYDIEKGILIFSEWCKGRRVVMHLSCPEIALQKK